MTRDYPANRISSYPSTGLWFSFTAVFGMAMKDVRKQIFLPAMSSFGMKKSAATALAMRQIQLNCSMMGGISLQFGNVKSQTVKKLT